MFKCRSCGSENIKSIIPLGKLPLANALLPSSVALNEPRHNLEVMLCEDCGLAQLRDEIDPAELFSDYVYFSSNSDTMLKSVADLVEHLVPSLPENAFVIEIASNDGYLLKNYIRHNINALGIDPAQNIAKVANENGIPTLCDFFGESLALSLASEGKKADIIHANNVMAHVPNINGFIAGIKHLLKPKGRAIIEVPYFMDLFEKLEFDTIYHEHVYYFSVKPLQIAFERHGLELFDIEKIAMHGGTLRLYVGHKDAYTLRPIVSEMIATEEYIGIYTSSTFDNFMGKLNTLKNNLLRVLTNLKNDGAKIAAYGASAKGTTLLNYFGITSEMIDFVVDRSVVKQGLYTPGTYLEIKEPSALIESKVTHALLLSWNFAEEIISQQQEFIMKGGKFIVPLPEVKIVP